MTDITINHTFPQSFNLGITIFIFLLTGMMLFSQILFIIYAMFLPISFLLSMIPTYENMAKQAVVRVFNAIMTRAGITLIVTVAFSISSMFYNISTDYPFFMVAFLQIICFAGIYMKLGELPVSGDYVFSELVNPVFTKDGDNLKVSVSVKYLDNKSKMTQISQYDLVLHKDDNWKIVG